MWVAASFLHPIALRFRMRKAPAPSSTSQAEGHRTEVYIRLRPAIANVDSEAELAVSAEGNTIVLGDRGTFGPFDGVLGPDATQQATYESMAQAVVESAVSGEANGTLLCYGQTGSGKTHSVGVHSMGLLPRALECVFSARAGAPAGEEWAIYLSCMQIYLEQPEDLLNLGGGAIKIREDAADPWGLVLVDGVVRVPLTSLEQATQLVEHADAQRS